MRPSPTPPATSCAAQQKERRMSTEPQPRPRIAISAGHHNHTGGNAREIEIVGPVTESTIAHLRAANFADVRSVTPRDGLGTFRGTVSDVAATVAAWAATGWRADLFFEVHAEANNKGDQARGSFLVFPDAHDGTDTDEQARDVLAPLICRQLLEQAGIPTRGDGNMSERETKIGREGHRLGIFAGTARYRQTMTRGLIEIASYTSPKDLAIMLAPGFSNHAGRAIANAIRAYFTDTDSHGGHVTPAPKQIRTYRVKVPAGANVRAQPNAERTTRILRALPIGERWPGSPITGTDGKTWIKGTVAGYIRADLLELAG